MPRRGRVAVIAALGAVLLVGCTGRDAEPTESPSREPSSAATTSPTPSATPTPEPITAPAPPEDLQRTDEVGAAAAATYFVNLYSYVMRTGDFAEWDRLSRPECTFCRETREYVSDTREAGGYFEGGAVQTQLIVVHPMDNLRGGYPVDVDVKQEATVARAADGSVLASSDAETFQARVDVLRQGDEWKVLEVADRAQP